MGKGICQEVNDDERWQKTGKSPVTVMWVDASKGTEESPAIRSRLAARDFRQPGDQDRQGLHAAIPPLEMKRMLASKAATFPANGSGRKIPLIDVKKAHLNLRWYLMLPEGANPEKGKRGKLVF